MGLPERLDRAFGQPFPVKTWPKNVAEHHRAEEQGHRKFFIEDRGKNSAIHAAADESPKPVARALQDASFPCAAKLLVAGRISNQMRHDALLQLRLARTRFINQISYEIGLDVA